MQGYAIARARPPRGFSASVPAAQLLRWLLVMVLCAAAGLSRAQSAPAASAARSLALNAILAGAVNPPALPAVFDHVRVGPTRGPHVLPMRPPGFFAQPLAAPAGAHLTYWGGAVISKVQVVQVLWGSGSYLPQVLNTAAPDLGSFYSNILASPYLDWLVEYDTNIAAIPRSNQLIGRGTYLGSYTITPAAANNGATISDSQVQSEVAAQISAGHLPAPSVDAGGRPVTYYAIFFPAGKTITQGTTQSCVSGGFCAYHGTLTRNGTSVYYGVHPDMQAGSGCATGCGGAANTFANQTAVAAHEVIEAITDPDVGLATVIGAPLAWYDSANGEIGDLCNAQQGTILGADGVSYTVQTEFSNTYGNCIVSVPSDFSLRSTSSSIALQAGVPALVTLSTAATLGLNQTIAFSISGLPAGVSGSFTPTSVTTGQSTTLTLSSLASSPPAPGTTSLTVTASANSATHTLSLGLSIPGATGTATGGGDVPTLPPWAMLLAGAALLGSALRVRAR